MGQRNRPAAHTAHAHVLAGMFGIMSFSFQTCFFLRTNTFFLNKEGKHINEKDRAFYIDILDIKIFRIKFPET